MLFLEVCELFMVFLCFHCEKGSLGKDFGKKDGFEKKEKEGGG